MIIIFHNIFEKLVQLVQRKTIFNAEICIYNQLAIISIKLQERKAFAIIDTLIVYNGILWKSVSLYISGCS